jgi:HK97 gp10 family phage protein
MGVLFSMRLQVGSGIDNYISKLQNLETTAPDVIGEAVYAGANIVADAIKENLENLPVDDTPFGERVTAPRTVQKKGLIKSFGVAKIRNDNGYHNVKLGFDGYNNVITKTWPQGQPNSMVARAVESGTSWMTKQPFMRRAESSAKGPCEQAMAKAVDEEIQRLIK